MLRPVAVCAVAALLALATVCHAGEPVAPRDLAARLQASQSDARPQVLDVRTAEEYAAGHVPGAVLIPHGDVAVRLGELDRTRPVVVYCRSGRRSGLAEGVLREAGFEVSQLEGSYPAWEAAQLPRECDGGPCPPSQVTPKSDAPVAAPAPAPAADE